MHLALLTVLGIRSAFFTQIHFKLFLFSLILYNIDFQLFPVEELEESFNFMRVGTYINKLTYYAKFILS